ncbi:class I SAM-dependent methyltransferase [Arthrobacter woluwensis]|uniref:class I SAM-dependent methyltransferase n=1 Tax=Arthrobacter woluwensis TaxID=156980 RepID=UPI003814EDD4
MTNRRNSTGRTLSSPSWLEAHHRAKLPERRKLAARLVANRPRSIVDLGCGTGLWLDIFDQEVAPGIPFVGLDSDPEALEIARHRARSWQRPAEFIKADISAEFDRIPSGDLVLLFNMFPYLTDAQTFLHELSNNGTFSTLAIRQYDGATIRFGPISPKDRVIIEGSLFDSLSTSSEFDHYGMDRAFSEIINSGLDVEEIWFDHFQRIAPFPPDFGEYLQGTLDWTSEHLSNVARDRLEIYLKQEIRYFSGTDLMAVIRTRRSD